MDAKALPALPSNPLTQEIFTAAIERLVLGDEITEVQRQILDEWIGYARILMKDLSVILGAWDARLTESS